MYISRFPAEVVSPGGGHARHLSLEQGRRGQGLASEAGAGSGARSDVGGSEPHSDTLSAAGARAPAFWAVLGSFTALYVVGSQFVCVRAFPAALSVSGRLRYMCSC